MDIAIPLFDRFTALDAIGPYETLSRLPGARVTFLAAEPGPVATELVSWVRTAHRTTEWTCSVCTGSLVLGAAGLLEGLEATTHWMAMDTLASTGAHPTGRRVVEQGKIITAAGVSAGIDMGLTLAARIAGDVVAQAIQLGIEYDPQPPFDAGSPEKAPAEVVAMCRNVEALIDAGQAV